MSKATPHPWILRSKADTVNVIGADGRCVCRVQRSAGPYMVNANLLKASPKLYEACELVSRDPRIPETARELLVFALAHARGER